MKFNTTLKILGSAIGCLFLFSAILNGQTYSFKNYGAESDIPSGFVYTINQSNDGFLWVGTGNGLSRFDGFTFFNVQYPDSTANRYPTASLKDKNGTLWFGCSDGSVFYARENNLIPVPLSNSKSISDLIEGPDGLIYIIPQGKAVFGINPIKPEEVHKYSFSSDPVMFSASFTHSGNVLIGTQENLLICKLDKDSVSVKGVIEGFNYSGITAIHQTDDSSRFVLGTDGNGLFQLIISGKGNVLTRFRDHPEWESLSIQSISEDSENYLWISTFGSGVIQLQLSDNYETVKSVRNYNINSGLTANDVKLVFQDIEENYWIGLYGEGISMLTSYAFGYYTPGENSLGNDVLYINSFNDNYILGTPSGFHLFDPVIGKSVSFTDLISRVGRTEITSYYLDREKNLWIGTGGNGLFVRNSSGSVKLFHKSGDSGADFIKDIEMDNQNIWLATTNGVIVLERRSGREKKRFDISNGLPHNSINTIFLARDGNAYIGTESDRLYKIDRDFNITANEAIMYGSTINKILSFSQSSDGVIWAATRGNGIFECLNDSVSNINRSNDLMSNYCYSILADSENNLWIGHEKGFSRFKPGTGIMRIFGTGFAKGGVCNPEGMFESADRKIFIGTTEGLIIYDRLKDRKNEVVPFNNINYILINDVRYPYQPSFSLPYNKKYVIRVYYSGINFSAPDKVYYSTYLENYDDDWSKMTTLKEVSYSLSDGKYKFNLISVNEEGLSQKPPVSFEILIKRPFWRSWWFILSVIAVISAIAVLIIRERDKAQKKIQEYLEKELGIRTSVVMKQKGEIELQHIEITDSINYAKRIQTSILPDINKLKESFKDAFILFHPRDIVSGDFYWFDKLGDDKFVLVCADSTGHGVPGAFMSMIGSTLLQDIVTRKRISKPSEILSLLDKQIFSTLNQNVELGVSNDGMDMVVCEFSIKTRHIRFASAMRPVIVVISGEQYYIKGNRSSVGGESVIEKFFDDQEYYLNEGDTIYLFSDGLPDQFGGTDGKKMKIARLKRVIDQVSKLPMNEQKEAISKFFFDWKGAYDQVDDILLMGVKV
ncbi:MAG: SpoIIE family protein phosphatase [Bacteroidia bacterium]|nr:SpoIIE family protein phosphatase [Bacteroidia bacterium]